MSQQIENKFFFFDVCLFIPLQIYPYYMVQDAEYIVRPQRAKYSFFRVSIDFQKSCGPARAHSTGQHNADGGSSENS